MSLILAVFSHFVQNYFGVRCCFEKVLQDLTDIIVTIGASIDILFQRALSYGALSTVRMQAGVFGSAAIAYDIFGLIVYVLLF